MDIRAGDWVELIGREAPHDYPRDWSWRVDSVHDHGMDVSYWSGVRVVCRRWGVGFSDVIAHRRDEQ